MLGRASGCTGAARKGRYRGPRYTDVAGLADVERVSAGFDHLCALKKGGKVACWGNDDFGQVSGTGLGRFVPPAEVKGLPPVAP